MTTLEDNKVEIFHPTDSMGELYTDIFFDDQGEPIHISIDVKSPLPCPFCGYRAAVFQAFLDADLQASGCELWGVQCCSANCDCFMGYYNSKETALDVWNTRA